MRNSAAVYLLITPPTPMDDTPLMTFCPSTKPPIVMFPVPLSSFDSVVDGIPPEQEVWPLAAIAIVTGLLLWPPPATVTAAKQSAAMFEGRTKFTCHKPG